MTPAKGAGVTNGDRFTWGVSTSAYQIEGAFDADGKGPSIWDVFAHEPGRVAGNDHGDVACDHLRHMDEDVALVRALGVDAYRFSVSWPRVQPEGRGRVEPRGLDVYDALVDRLLAAGIEPWPCLYHWDLPYALAEGGGWADRDTVARFADYAEIVADRLADRVRTWAMLNEPNVHALLGHLLGVHAPGATDLPTYVAAAHHQNLATGRAVRRLRARHADLRLGTIVNLQPARAAGDGEDDAAAAALLDAAWNGNHLEPLVRGRYPAATEPMFASVVRTGDLEETRAGLDFLGVNFYAPQRVAADANSLVGLRLADPPADAETTAMGWEVEPDALEELLRSLSSDPDVPPLVVTENGAAYPDRPGPDGYVEDPARVTYLRRHVAAVQRARAAGARVFGYFAWTLLDNFEWAEGYRRRFGLVRVDFETQRRTPKASFDAYAAIVRDGGV